MKPREQERELQRKLVDSIVFVATNHQPENWLPMKVTVIEYPEDENGEEQQRLAECMLKEIFESEECCMREIGTATDEPYGVSEISISRLSRCGRSTRTSAIGSGVEMPLPTLKPTPSLRRVSSRHS